MANKKIYKSLKHSFIDGTFFSVMFGFGDSYFQAFAIALKATNFQIGLLSSLPGLVSSLFQIKIPDWTERVGRYKFMCASVLAQVVIWAPIILIPFVFKANPAWWLILFVTAYALAGSFAVPAWGSIMSQYLPAAKRGKYFAWRNKIHGAITVAATFLAGLTLYLFPRESLYGFMVIFTVAMASRFISWRHLTKMFEPRLAKKTESFFSLWDFLSRTRQSNFARFVFFVAAFNAAVSFASPFFAVYMLRELGFDYLSFVIINISVTLATLLSLQAWGAHTDKSGCISVIRLTSIIIPFLPMLWLISSSKPFLIVVQLISGFAWGGFNLAVSNFIYDAVSEEKRVRCIAYFNLINGLGLFLGASLGGYLVSVIPPINGSRFLSIFLLSGLARMLIRSFMLPNIKEVRKVSTISNADLFFGVIGLKATTSPDQSPTKPE